MSGLPLLTEAITRSETPAAESLPLTVLLPITVNTLITFAPELSQVSTWLPTLIAFVILAFIACIYTSNFLSALPVCSSFFSTSFLTFASSSASILSLNPFSFPKTSTITKFFVLLNGLHSIILTISPSCAFMHAGLWAFTLLFLFSYLSYFFRKCLRSQLTVAVFCILADIMVPTKVLPLHFNLPWNGQLSSSHLPAGFATFIPIFFSFILFYISCLWTLPTLPL